MGDANADTGAANTGTETTTEAKGTEAKAPPPKTFTQDEVNAFLAREKRALHERLSNAETAAAELAKLREEMRQQEEAKLSATQRAELERKRERDAYEKRVAELDALAKREREMRHATLREQRAAETVAGFAAKLLNERLATTVKRELASRLVVEQQADGTERLMVRMSDAAADLEPAETGLVKIVDTEIAPTFFRAQGGSGAQHGSGNGASANAWKHLSPSDKIAAGLAAKR